MQDARKQLGFEVSDRIDLWWSSAREDTAAAIRTGAGTLGTEVLATSVTDGEGPGDLWRSVPRTSA